MRLALEGYRSVFGIAGPLIFVSGILYLLFFIFVLFLS